MGCPYPCAFCHEPVIRAPYRSETKSDYLRRKSVARTVAEIKDIKDRYPLRHVHFSDDLFFIRNNYKWLEEFAEVYPLEVGPFAREFRNIASLFWLMVKFPPSWIPFFKKVVALPDNIVFRIIGSFNMVQELLFYRVRPIPALRYFRNTVMMTGKSGLSMTMRTIPSLFRRNRAAAALAQPREIYESNRGYF